MGSQREDTAAAGRMRGPLLLFLLLALSNSTNNECPPGTECMAMRFCTSEEVESLHPEKFCGVAGFLRYCCTPQIRQFPEEPKEPKEPVHPEKVRCFKDLDCPVTELPSGFEDILPDVKVYQCPSYECDYDDLNEACIEEKSCQPKTVPFCAHPKGKEHSACENKTDDPVYFLNKAGHIECNLDSDCPPTARPSWEWNEKTKMENGVSSITEMSIEVSRCSSAVVDTWGEYRICGPYGPWKCDISLCDVKSEPFCGHQYGRNHPECKRCNVLTPLPEPQCLDYELNKKPKRFDIDSCCRNLFNVKFITKTEEWQLDGEDYYTNLRAGILQNFTINDCRLSALHIPPDSPPRTLFDPQLCCSFGFCRAACSNCIPASFGRLPPFLTAATGTGSLTPRRKSQSCPSAHCKRPSLARPGNLICCLLIRAPWGNRRIAICPYSCD